MVVAKGARSQRGWDGVDSGDVLRELGITRVGFIKDTRDIKAKRMGSFRRICATFFQPRMDTDFLLKGTVCCIDSDKESLSNCFGKPQAICANPPEFSGISGDFY